jgi:hypothetical protein
VPEQLRDLPRATRLAFVLGVLGGTLVIVALVILIDLVA